MTDRYSRQQLFAPIGDAGQGEISRSHVLIVGAGALGSASAEAMVRSGVGRLTIIDRDYVEWSNLQRQTLYTEADARNKLPKAVAAQKHLEQINSNVQIEGIVMDARADNMDQLLKGVDVIMDGSDNFDIRFIINDLSQKHDIPWVYGSCVGSYGATFTILPGETPCLHCVLKAMPMTGATCDTVGIISPTVQMVAAYQTAEAMKILVGDRDTLRKTFLTFDLWNNQHYTFTLNKAKSADCLSCGEERTYPYLSFENQTKSEVLCGRNTVQIRPSRQMLPDFDRLEQTLAKNGKVERNPYLLSCQMDGHRMVIFQDGRVFVHGTNEIEKAKRLYYGLLG